MKERKDNFVSKVCSVEDGMACNAHSKKRLGEQKHSLHVVLIASL